jgi:hypothetical protein
MTSFQHVAFYPARGALWVAILASLPVALIARHAERSVWTYLTASVLWMVCVALVQFSGSSVQRRGSDVLIVSSVRRVGIPVDRVAGVLWLDAVYIVTTDGHAWPTRLGSRTNFQNTIDSAPARRVWPHIDALGDFARLAEGDAYKLARSAIDARPRRSYIDGWAWPTPLMWAAHIGVTVLIGWALLA